MTQRVGAFVITASLVTLGLTACGTSERSGAAPSRQPAPNVSTVAALRSKIMTYAADMGDGSPSDLRYYATDLGTVLQAEGGIARSDDTTIPVYVLMAHGSFRSSRPRPPGSRAPTGRVLMIALDAKTLGQLELVLGPTDPDVSKLGPAHDF